MPTLARWIKTGSHKIVSWECDLSSQTSASQAGILQGNNFDIPAFRWYEKDTGKQMTSNHPLDTIEIERRISNGNGLLANCGASRSNLFSGMPPKPCSHSALLAIFLDIDHKTSIPSTWDLITSSAYYCCSFGNYL